MIHFFTQNFSQWALSADNNAQSSYYFILEMEITFQYN